MSVKASQTLTLGAVLKDNGTFRPYQAAFHAKGLLYCASMNTAMNDHLAQFVRGAHAMTGTAVLIMLITCIPEGKASLRTAPNSQSPTAVKITGPIEVFSKGAGEIPPCDPVAAEGARLKQVEQQPEELRSRLLEGHRSSSKARVTEKSREHTR